VIGLRAGPQQFDSRQGLAIFIFATTLKLALGATEPFIQWIPGVKRPGPEADLTSQLPPMLRMRGAVHTLPRLSSWRDD